MTLDRRNYRLLQHSLNKAFFTPVVFFSFSFIGYILQMWEATDKFQDSIFNPNPTHQEVFDFIVVGAGSSGSLLVNRLAKHDYKVLLLEAGGEPNPIQSIPSLNFYLLNYPQTDWMFKTVPQKNACLNSKNQQSSWNAGRGLGGGGIINGMIHIRGHPKDYDQWANLTGDPSWGWSAVLPYFRKHEDYGVPGANEKYHGFGQDLRIEAPDFEGLTNEFIAGAQELGVPLVDLNGYYTGEGVERIYFPLKNGERQAGRAFLDPARKLKNLTIRKYSFVTKVLFNGDVAYGVEYERQGKTLKAVASKEVILSAGAISTTKILMLSGLGPRDQLEKHGIPVLVDLPVGKNLQDHLSVFFGPVFINKPPPDRQSTIVFERDISPETALKYFLENGRGDFSAPGATTTALFSSSFAKKNQEWPDIQMFMYGFSVFDSFPKVISHAYGLNEEEMKSYHKNAVNRESIYLAISGARPLSRGDIQLGGKGLHDDLIIDPKYLEDPNDQDFQVLQEGVQIALKLFENTTAFGKVGAEFSDAPLPGCEHFTLRTQKYWECFIKRFSVTLHHFCGTATMGRSNDPSSVVDTQLRVIGTKGLRVVDQSIFPTVVATNTQATVFMVAEKAADMILTYWSERKKINVSSSPSESNYL